MRRNLVLFSLLLVIFGSCNHDLMKRKPVRLALSAANENYINWVHRTDSTVLIFDLKGLETDSAIKLLETCDGIVFTGGEDVDPSIYGSVADSALCKTDTVRDKLEFALVKKAFKLKIPVLGICRGLQLINVNQKGTLVTDIPTYYPNAIVHKCEDYTSCFHKVSIDGNTLLQEVSKADTGTVNTNHHQAIARLGEGLKISAHAEDGLPEAMEWADPKDKGYLMAVQWHPERMKQGNPLSDPLMRAFLQACIIRGVLK